MWDGEVQAERTVCRGTGHGSTRVTGTTKVDRWACARCGMGRHRPKERFVVGVLGFLGTRDRSAEPSAEWRAKHSRRSSGGTAAKEQRRGRPCGERTASRASLASSGCVLERGAERGAEVEAQNGAWNRARSGERGAWRKQMPVQGTWRAQMVQGTWCPQVDGCTWREQARRCTWGPQEWRCTWGVQV